MVADTTVLCLYQTITSGDNKQMFYDAVISKTEKNDVDQSFPSLSPSKAWLSHKIIKSDLKPHHSAGSSWRIVTSPDEMKQMAPRLFRYAT